MRVQGGHRPYIVLISLYMDSISKIQYFVKHIANFELLNDTSDMTSFVAEKQTCIHLSLLVSRRSGILACKKKMVYNENIINSGGFLV